MKKFIAGLIVGILLFSIGLASTNLTAFYSNDTTLRVEGRTVDNVVPITIIEEGQTDGFNTLPIRALGEALGYKVSYDAQRKIIDLEKPNIYDVAMRNVESCVLVRVYNETNVMWHGSGVIYNDYIITNAHVLDKGTRYTIEYHYTPGEVKVERIKLNTRLDIGLLKVPYESKSVTIGNSQKMRIGDEVVLISSPNGQKNTVTSGIISAIRPMPYSVGGHDEFQTTANARGGSSGGGLFNIKGELIGIACRAFEDENMSYAIPISPILGEIKRNK